jgi:hypothetical protein
MERAGHMSVRFRGLASWISYPVPTAGLSGGTLSCRKRVFQQLNELTREKRLVGEGMIFRF